MNRIAAFYEPVEDVDADGQVVQSWLLRFTVAAHVQYLRGSEAVMQARLQSKSPAIITVRHSAQAQGITSEWRAKVDGRTFEIREDPRPDQKRRLLEMLAEA
ncbi:phage head closure protein [Paracoccus sp. YLB-12]|uniref:Phage head closure protein n=1 Tax=Paracoccus maritimus TaxID=2933292 RepID=A0ABT2KB74_9RHOB|nr:phage head closure protein [Paracoccus sp. YLB-12]MCT4333781.1 phage head closure protein [Paracoccus sp. YLB-12]